MRNLLIAVGCCGALAWAGRQIVVSRGPRTVHDRVRSLQGGRPEQRHDAAQELGSANAADAIVVLPALIGAMGDQEGLVRTQAALSLGRYLATAAPAVGQPLMAIIRSSAAEALTHFGPTAAPAGPDLIRLLDDKVPQVRAAAAQALGLIGPSAARAIPRLRQLLEDPARGVGEAAAAALESLAAPGRPSEHRSSET